MKEFVLKVITISIISFGLILLYSLLADKCAPMYYGPTTAEQVNMSFENAVKDTYNCYFLGNSRIYRDINPDCFKSVKAYNFAHDNDSYNQMYYKLLYLMKKGESIDYLIIGTDYFQFSFLSDTRNYIYSRLFPKEYSDDFDEHSWFKTQEKFYTTIWRNKQNALEACVKYTLRRPVPDEIPYQKPNGQYITYGEADPEETIDRDYTVLDLQYDYFKRIISVCEEQEIEMYVVMPPLWNGEIKSHTDTEREDFNNMIKEELKATPYANNYINYSDEMGLSSYTDFIDITHLKAAAADDFSIYINNRIFGE